MTSLSVDKQAALYVLFGLSASAAMVMISASRAFSRVPCIKTLLPVPFLEVGSVSLSL